MTWSELRNKCRRESDYIITLFVTNEVSLFITWMLVKTRVTPNQVTIASLFCGVIGGLCYLRGWFLIGSFFLFMSHVLDCTDGNLARAKEKFNDCYWACLADMKVRVEAFEMLCEETNSRTVDEYNTDDENTVTTFTGPVYKE